MTKWRIKKLAGRWFAMAPDGSYRICYSYDEARIWFVKETMWAPAGRLSWTMTKGMGAQRA